MTDIVDSKTRSRMMAGIRGRDTKPELRVRHFLHRSGLRYTLGNKKLPGKPDIVLPKHRVAVFVHGCFWHRHANCRYATTPATRPDFWLKKFDQNVTRDQKVRQLLREDGWRTLVIWECELSLEKLKRLRQDIVRPTAAHEANDARFETLRAVAQ